MAPVGVPSTQGPLTPPVCIIHISLQSCYYDSHIQKTLPRPLHASPAATPFLCFLVWHNTSRVTWALCVDRCGPLSPSAPCFSALPWQASSPPHHPNVCSLKPFLPLAFQDATRSQLCLPRHPRWLVPPAQSKSSLSKPSAFLPSAHHLLPFCSCKFHHHTSNAKCLSPVYLPCSFARVRASLTSSLECLRDLSSSKSQDAFLIASPPGLLFLLSPSQKWLWGGGKKGPWAEQLWGGEPTLQKILVTTSKMHPDQPPSRSPWHSATLHHHLAPTLLF